MIGKSLPDDWVRLIYGELNAWDGLSYSLIVHSLSHSHMEVSS